MNNFNIFISALISVALLTACNNGASNAASSANQESSAPIVNETAAPNKVKLSSKDGLININVEGEFVDKSGDAQFLPEGEDPKNVLLLQYDEARDVSISAVESGALKDKADTFFVTLKQNIESDKTLKDVQVETINEQRLAYGFSSGEETTVQEYCLTDVASNKHIYTTCAISGQLTVNDLKAILSDVKISTSS